MSQMGRTAWCRREVVAMDRRTSEGSARWLSWCIWASDGRVVAFLLLIVALPVLLLGHSVINPDRDSYQLTPVSDVQPEEPTARRKLWATADARPGSGLAFAFCPPATIRLLHAF